MRTGTEMNAMLSRILVLASVSGLLLLTAGAGQGASAPQTDRPARVDTVPKQTDRSSKRSGSKSKRSDNRSRRSDGSSSRPDSSQPRQERSSTGQTNYESFKIIADRNIFSASRTGGYGSTPANVEFFALAGTLSYEKGTFAFFDGSGTEYRKVLKPEGTIAEFKVTEITPNTAKLEANNRTVEMLVGMQLRREDQGEWKLSIRTNVPGSSDTDRGSSSRFGSDRGSSRFGSDRGSSDRGPSRFGGDRGSSRFGGDRGSSNGGPSRFGGDRGSSRFGGDRGSNNGGPSRFGGDRSTNGGDSGSRSSDSQRSYGSSGQSSDGASREEVLRRLMEQRRSQTQ